MEAERYQVREVTGYAGNAGTNGSNRETTDVMVLDSWYAWACVAYFSGATRGAWAKDQTLPSRRERAAVVAARWNAE